MDERASIPPSLPRENPTESYWQNPLDPLASHRSSQELPSVADYVIIGSGITGTCIAFELLERRPDAKIVMLEARGASSGATGRNGGHTKAASYRSFPLHVEAHGVEEAVRIARLELDNINATHAFAAKHRIECESLPCRTVDVIYDQTSFMSGVSAIDLMRESVPQNDPVAEYDILSPAEVCDQFLVDPSGVKGAFSYAAGSISAYKFSIGILKLCLSRGLNLQSYTPVTSILPCSSPSRTSSLSPPDEVTREAIMRWSTVTPRGTVKTRNLILATNGYTARLLPQFISKIVPLRGQVTAHRLPPALKSESHGLLGTSYSFIYAQGYEYMISRPNMPTVPAECIGDVVIGGGLAIAPDNGLLEYGETDDSGLNYSTSRYLHETTRKYFGTSWGDDIPEKRVRKEWTGIMGITGDGLPYVGSVPESEGLWVAAGFNGHGMVLCLKSAEALVHMILGDHENTFEWFPRSLLLTKKRMDETSFEGRQGMTAPPDVKSSSFA